MGEQKPINGTKGWTVLLSAIVSAMAGSGGGVYIYMRSVTPQQMQALARPDPATGTELKALERRVDRHLDNHPDQANMFDRRITTLEAEVRALERRMDREDEL